MTASRSTSVFIFDSKGGLTVLLFFGSKIALQEESLAGFGLSVAVCSGLKLCETSTLMGVSKQLIPKTSVVLASTSMTSQLVPVLLDGILPSM